MGLSAEDLAELTREDNASSSGDDEPKVREAWTDNYGYAGAVSPSYTMPGFFNATVTSIPLRNRLGQPALTSSTHRPLLWVIPPRLLGIDRSCWAIDSRHDEVSRGAPARRCLAMHYAS
jgi:hypothetical protein